MNHTNVLLNTRCSCKHDCFENVPRPAYWAAKSELDGSQLHPPKKCQCYSPTAAHGLQPSSLKLDSKPALNFVQPNHAKRKEASFYKLAMKLKGQEFFFFFFLLPCVKPKSCCFPLEKQQFLITRKNKS